MAFGLVTRVPEPGEDGRAILSEGCMEQTPELVVNWKSCALSKAGKAKGRKLPTWANADDSGLDSC